MFGLFSAKKPFNAQVNATATRLEVPAGDNLLNAALNSGLAWPHNCRVGSCGTCRCKLIDGEIKALNDFGYVLDADELDQGMILACQTRLRTDISVEVTLENQTASFVPAQESAGVIS
ncbi:MAG: 2Fe-2S iron-sulfur cluster binding domain-containing protein, partial [Gammaproteobacteria bacterium]|nr:2Fe-2S iron-sulfur cluster binding domain-containing protein [Gammaproteobacteria bacterium]